MHTEFIHLANKNVLSESTNKKAKTDLSILYEKRVRLIR